MAILEYQNIKPYSRTGNVAPSNRPYKMAASQGLFIAGHPFFINSTSGTLIKGDTCDNSDDVYHVIVTENCTTEKAVGDLVNGVAITTDILWAIRVTDNGDAAAAAQALVGNEYGIAISTTTGQIGYTVLDTNNSYTAVHVENVMGNLESGRYDLTSTTKNIAIVRFLAANIDATRSS